MGGDAASRFEALAERVLDLARELRDEAQRMEDSVRVLRAVAGAVAGTASGTSSQSP